MQLLKKVKRIPTNIKLVKNDGSINVVANEDCYYAKGISNVRKLKGKVYEY